MYLPGWTLSAFRALQLATTASSLAADRPATAHWMSVGKFLAM